MTSPNKRKNMDVMKLMMSNYNVEMSDDEGTDFYVDFSGPKDTLYEGGAWKVHVNLPADYPFRSPSIGFKNRIFHPNVDFRSGTICLDVINQTWSPMYDLLNIFDVFLPQLLSYPNAEDPLNNEAAVLLLEEPDKYKATVKEFVEKYAKQVISESNQPSFSLSNQVMSKEISQDTSLQTSQFGQTTMSPKSSTTINSLQQSILSHEVGKVTDEQEDDTFSEGSAIDLHFEHTFDLEI